MGSTSVTVVLPLIGGSNDIEPARPAIATYLRSIGFDFDILPIACSGHGNLLRRGVSEARGEVIVILDPSLPYPVSAIGDAVGMIESGTADIVFGTVQPVGGASERGRLLVRSLLVRTLADESLHLKAFSSEAARLVIGESRLDEACDLEIAYLANKYGLRVERLFVRPRLRDRKPRPFARITDVVAAMRIRLVDRNNGYRAARRCPVCFSNEVWSYAQIPDNIVRACNRCKCRYLNRFPDDDAQLTLPMERPRPVASVGEHGPHSATAKEKTSLRRLGYLRRELPARARVLEVGVSDGSFGAAVSRDFEYVGIDPAAASARAARGRGLDVYCASLLSFVNTGSAFDAIALFHVLEKLSDPHDALARVKELLKPGGILLLTGFDTEGLVYLLTERKRLVPNFRNQVILYSRSALIELLEHSGFEIISVGPDFEYRDHRFLRHWLGSRWPLLASLVRGVLKVLPDPLIVSSGSMRIMAKRRGGPPFNVRTIRAVEPTHAR